MTIKQIMGLLVIMILAIFTLACGNTSQNQSASTKASVETDKFVGTWGPIEEPQYHEGTKNYNYLLVKKENDGTYKVAELLLSDSRHPDSPKTNTSKYVALSIGEFTVQLNQNNEFKLIDKDIQGSETVTYILGDDTISTRLNNSDKTHIIFKRLSDKTQAFNEYGKVKVEDIGKIHGTPFSEWRIDRREDFKDILSGWQN